MKTHLISAARLSTLVLAPSAGGLVASAATAQDVPIVGKATLGVTVTEAQMVAAGWRASKMIHTDVYNDKNEKIGRVDDLIVAPDGSLSAAISMWVAFSGWRRIVSPSPFSISSRWRRRQSSPAQARRR